MHRVLISLLSGFVFALGLGISGMTQPQKVIGFLDLFGTWNPALAFVMVGAIGVHAVAYLIAGKKTAPFLEDKFYVPKNNQIDLKLISGSVLFGIGWGLAGFCPGPAITSLASNSSTVFLFVTSMVTGMLAFKLISILRPNL